MRARGPLSGSAGAPHAAASPTPLHRRRGQLPMRKRAIMHADAFIDLIASGLMLLAVIATFTLSVVVLTNWKIHYLTAGGNFYEKLHPATYFTLLAFSLLLIRNSDPIGEINRMFSEAKLCWSICSAGCFCWSRCSCSNVRLRSSSTPFCCRSCCA